MATWRHDCWRSRPSCRPHGPKPLRKPPRYAVTSNVQSMGSLRSLISFNAATSRDTTLRLSEVWGVGFHDQLREMTFLSWFARGVKVPMLMDVTA